MKTVWSMLIGCLLTITACKAQQDTVQATKQDYPITKTEEQWKQELTPEQYRVLREKGTELPGSGTYNLHFKDGIYTCAGCHAPLFTSESKFDAHCGWPSFDAALADSTIIERVDRSHGMVRTEIVCASCGGHLGHVFNDGPTDTGMRYCVNSAALEFEEEK